MEYKVEHKKRYNKLFMPNDISQYLKYMVKHESLRRKTNILYARLGCTRLMPYIFGIEDTFFSKIGMWYLFSNISN